MIHLLINAYFAVNYFLAGFINGANINEDNKKSTILGGTLLTIFFGLPIAICCYVYAKLKTNKL